MAFRAKKIHIIMAFEITHNRWHWGPPVFIMMITCNTCSIGFAEHMLMARITHIEMGTRSTQHPCSFFSPLDSEIRHTNVQNSEVCGPRLQNLQKRNLQGGDGYASYLGVSYG